jgi:hypothetical protein
MGGKKSYQSTNLLAPAVKGPAHYHLELQVTRQLHPPHRLNGRGFSLLPFTFEKTTIQCIYPTDQPADASSFLPKTVVKPFCPARLAIRRAAVPIPTPAPAVASVGLMPLTYLTQQLCNY